MRRNRLTLLRPILYLNAPRLMRFATNAQHILHAVLCLMRWLHDFRFFGLRLAESEKLRHNCFILTICSTTERLHFLFKFNQIGSLL